MKINEDYKNWMIISNQTHFFSDLIVSEFMSHFKIYC